MAIDGNDLVVSGYTGNRQNLRAAEILEIDRALDALEEVQGILAHCGRLSPVGALAIPIAIRALRKRRAQLEG